MDERIKRLKTPEACETFAKNAIRYKEYDLAVQALQHAIKLRAQSHGTVTQAEKECLEAVYAYEEVLSKKRGKRTRATRTWQMIKRHGILVAAERAVNRSTETVGYKALLDMGLQKFAFESVILRYPELFSEEAVQRCRERMKQWQDG